MGVPVPVPWVLSFPIPSINGTRPRLQYERSRNLSFTKAIIQIILVAGLLCPYNYFHVVVIQRNYTTLYRLCNNFILIKKNFKKDYTSWSIVYTWQGLFICLSKPTLSRTTAMHQWLSCPSSIPTEYSHRPEYSRQ